jgi:hypothetical protein
VQVPWPVATAVGRASNASDSFDRARLPEAPPWYQQKFKNVRVWTMRTIVAGILVLVVGCGKQASLFKVSITDLIDKTASYKGQTITLKLAVGDSNLSTGKSLRDYVGQNVKFYTWGEKGARLDIVIAIPEGLTVPNAGWGDHLNVTFVCKNGSLRDGNEAKSIERP